jgi:ABC-2 type transport system ATP-binding protein
MSQPAVETFEIRKCFGELCAVKDISIRVEAGEFFGFLGPNGAGKSTLIRMLTTVLRPSAGTATVAGYDITKSAADVRRAIGVVPQSMSSDLDLTGWENMDIYGKLYEVPKKLRHERINELLERVGLTNKAKDLVATYSGGMRRRLDIARVLVHMPSILFLDEPTTGLDPQSRRVVWEMLQGFMKSYSLTIFLTTHYMEEAETLCGRVAIIDKGSIIALGTPDELKAAIPEKDAVVLEVGGDVEKALAAVKEQPYVDNVVADGEQLRCYVHTADHAAPMLMKLLVELGITVSSVHIKRQSLEDVFIHHTGRSIREEESRKVSLFIGAGVPRKLN